MNYLFLGIVMANQCKIQLREPHHISKGLYAQLVSHWWGFLFISRKVIISEVLPVVVGATKKLNIALSDNGSPQEYKSSALYEPATMHNKLA